MPPRETIGKVLHDLTTNAEKTAQLANEEWGDTIQRIHVTKRIHQICEEVFDYFLDILPPKLQGGNWYAFAEGQERLRLFWQRGGEYYCRFLTWEETERVCDASGMRRDYGYY